MSLLLLFCSVGGIGDGTGLCYVRNDYTGVGCFMGTVTVNATEFATNGVNVLSLFRGLVDTCTVLFGIRYLAFMSGDTQ